MDVAEFDTGGKSDNPVRAGNDPNRINSKFGLLVVDVNYQPGNVARAGLVGQGIMKDVVNPGGRAVVASIAVITARIDTERAILTMDRQLAGGEAGVASPGTVNRDNLADTAAHNVESGRSGDRANPGNYIAGGGAIIARRKMIRVIARVDQARSRVGSIFVSHNRTFAPAAPNPKAAWLL